MFLLCSCSHLFPFWKRSFVVCASSQANQPKWWKITCSKYEKASDSIKMIRRMMHQGSKTNWRCLGQRKGQFEGRQATTASDKKSRMTPEGWWWTIEVQSVGKQSTSLLDLLEGHQLGGQESTLYHCIQRIFLRGKLVVSMECNNSRGILVIWASWLPCKNL